MSDYSTNIKPSDRRLISPQIDVKYDEPEQIIQENPPSRPDVAAQNRQDLARIREKAQNTIDRIAYLESKLDEKCSRFSVDLGAGRGSPLWQATYRIFGRGKSIISYDDYSRALEIRRQLAEEDTDHLRRT